MKVRLNDDHVDWFGVAEGFMDIVIAIIGLLIIYGLAAVAINLGIAG